MASAQINMPDKVESIKIYRDKLAKKRATIAAKKKQTTGKSKGGVSTVPEQILESSPERSPSKKRQKRDSVVDRQKKVASDSKDKSVVTTFEPDSSMKLLSSGISSFKDLTGFLDRSNEFLLPADDLFLKGKKMQDAFNTGILFQALQVQLHLHDRYKSVNDKCVKYRKANDIL
ncbi:hypothetical protein LWI29_027454 [Acer saccharum]|uniref:Uncharacterized protein n=1 Tax=Acer saccharum TaxID=4024 RepID=A0AA39RF34_ACESA|nr:hypothetical protein LWI29_027454 [Acer saccharum]